MTGFMICVGLCVVAYAIDVGLTNVAIALDKLADKATFHKFPD